MIIEDQGIIIGLKNFEERYIFVKCFLKTHGLMYGLLSNSKTARKDFMIRNIVEVTWSARLREQLGYFKFELAKNIISLATFDRLSISVINSAISMLLLVLNEKEKQLDLYQVLYKLLDSMSNTSSSQLMRLYLNFELEILRAGGFGLDLQKCIVTGQNNDLYYISPKSGAAVSKNAGLAYHDKLLLLEENILHLDDIISIVSFLKCLDITQFFIEKNILTSCNKKMPLERNIMLDTFKKLIKNQ